MSEEEKVKTIPVPDSAGNEPLKDQEKEQDKGQVLAPFTTPLSAGNPNAKQKTKGNQGWLKKVVSTLLGQKSAGEPMESIKEDVTQEQKS